MTNETDKKTEPAIADMIAAARDRIDAMEREEIATEIAIAKAREADFAKMRVVFGLCESLAQLLRVA